MENCMKKLARKGLLFLCANLFESLGYLEGCAGHITKGTSFDLICFVIGATNYPWNKIPGQKITRWNIARWKILGRNPNFSGHLKISLENSRILFWSGQKIPGFFTQLNSRTSLDFFIILPANITPPLYKNHCHQGLSQGAFCQVWLESCPCSFTSLEVLLEFTCDNQKYLR